MRGARAWILVCGLLHGTACTADVTDEGASTNVDATTDIVSADDTKADGATTGELRTRVTGLTLWVDREVRREVRDGRAVWVLRGRTSRNLTDVFSFVPDDPFGTATVVGARRFEVTLDAASEVNSILSGLPLFVGITTTGGDWKAALWIAPRFASFSGSSRLYVEQTLHPIHFAGHLRYRGDVSLAHGASLASVTTAADGGDVTPTLVPFDGGVHVDWSFDELAAALAPPDAPVVLAGRDASGRRLRKEANLGIALASAGLTTEDPYEVWPSPLCTPERQACLDGLSFGDPDTSTCGSYREVAHCAVTTVLPELDAAGDAPPAALARIDTANASRSGDRVIALAAYGYDWSGAGPGLEQVAYAWASSGGLEDPSLTLELPRAELDAALAHVGLDGLVGDLETLPGARDVAIARILTDTETTSGEPATTTHYLLHYRNAVRLFVVSVPE